MSTLSKLLIVLLSVLVLLQTAATVVFVNRVDAAVGARNTAEDGLKVATAKVSALQSELAKASADLGTSHQQAQAQIAELEGRWLKSEQAKADYGTQIAKLTSSNVIQGNAVDRLTATVQATGQENVKLAEALASARKINEDVTRKITEVNAANSDLTNRLEVTERERRYFQEQNVELQNRASHASTTQPSSGTAMAVVPSSSAPSINATVRATNSIANIPYATISAGSADRVEKGMTFTLIDSQGNFLGYLTVDQVDTNEAAGRLSGPRIADVKVGTDARTHL